MKVSQRRTRSAMILLAVLIVISIMTFSAYEFTHWVGLEVETSLIQAKETQARYLAESGVAYIEAMETLRRRGQTIPSLDNNPDLFDRLSISLEAKDVASAGTNTEPLLGMFTVRCQEAPHEESASPAMSVWGEASDRFGVESEAGRIHINAWFVRDPAALEAALLALPGSSKELVQGVLDWMDADSDRREGGAEREEYDKLDPPLSPRNGLLESLDELLLVKGMSPEIFEGEDSNHNGVLDPEENDGDRNPPMDDEDGVLDLGWRAYLTLWSREMNEDSVGRARIWLNQPDLGRLYTAIEKEFGIEWARWVVSARVVGTAGMLRHPESREMGPFHFASLLDLVDARVVGQYEQKQIDRVSPVSSSMVNFGDELERLMDRWTVEGMPVVAGCVDVTSASGPALSLLTSLTDEDRKKVRETRPPVGLRKEESGSEQEKPIKTNAWLLVRGVLPKEKLRAVENSIRSRSDVVRFESEGQAVGERLSYRMEVVVDRGRVPMQVLSRCRLDRWKTVDSIQQEGDEKEKELPTLGESTFDRPIR